ncbi:MAG: chemotaxis response regulator protein-glutamate methylesterase [Mobiluncus porci]|uniref:Protein-glutamate methylesterase/protein-glutamine glutaminase n=1 Tax=Mobiluncus porci TaxID=2652278 RepID=A0A7K0K533_9ACTO|nr:MULTISPECIES: chemotaxis response regulator protein-glutamate methylesterase [Mobiluncus]MCI6584904.1 chemotaxis response regulator protein-glutamate methylesterase [Mobiluncus sp.]MDD7540967.1 chemotaxis response regulator protein-glutamate methylesterase [Mobiluncus porci]MDY5748142.1 chemotaxis response regulator protein-glutamate methylesterase [Mobiluncus porci]MST50538.1 chemotaxis response regulator protein-glutamate methylesterase [Mobiluncus porci]
MAGIKVLVVDDSVVVRKIVTDALNADPSIEVVGTAPNGKLALMKWKQLKPDAITMDIEMPVMNGIEAVRELRKMGCKEPIIMFSTLTQRGATATLEALSAGATDYVTKPANQGSVQQSMQTIREQLVPIIVGLLPGKARASGLTSSKSISAEARANISSVPAMFAGPVKLHDRTGMPDKPIRIVILGSSTGGPEALSKVISGLKPLPVPLVITQHMPPVFTTQLAARLDRMTSAVVQEASEGMMLAPGHIYLAAGNYHMTFAGNAGAPRIKMTQTPPVNFCRPSVDVMFESAVQMYGGEMLAVVLTGMGQDGKEGCKKVLEAGGRTLVQDENTSVVWGMPGAVATAGFADQILPLDQIANEISRHVVTHSAQEKR